MLMPFGSAYTVHNLGIEITRLPLVYLISGCCSIFVGPLVGRATDRFGAWPTFVFGSLLGIVMTLIYTHLGITPLPVVILVNALMFVGIFSRMIPAQAMISLIPSPARRGAYGSISASMQQVAGGVGSILAGLIVIRNADGSLSRFDDVGYVLIGTSVLALILIRRLDRVTRVDPT